jgi:hypothetical protein
MLAGPKVIDIGAHCFSKFQTVRVLITKNKPKRLGL